MHILFCGIYKKLLLKEIKYLTFQVSDSSTHFFKKSFPIMDQTFTMSRLEICSVFIDSIVFNQ